SFLLSTANSTLKGKGDHTLYGSADDVALTDASVGGVYGRVHETSTTKVLHGGVPPTYSAINLANEVTGTLPVANGGTGSTSVTWWSLSGNAVATSDFLGGTSANTNPLVIKIGGSEKASFRNEGFVGIP